MLILVLKFKEPSLEALGYAGKTSSARPSFARHRFSAFHTSFAQCHCQASLTGYITWPCETVSDVQ